MHRSKTHVAQARLIAVFVAVAFIGLQASSSPQVSQGAQLQPWDAGTRYPDFQGPSTLA